LPFKHAQIIVLHYFQNVPLAEVARRLKLEQAVVDQMHFDALMRLKRKTK
jgi:DNA-directed RNA polymerase specialized sigma subunit